MKRKKHRPPEFYLMPMMIGLFISLFGFIMFIFMHEQWQIILSSVGAAIMGLFHFAS